MRIFLTLLSLLIPTLTLAAPAPYDLNQSRSKVQFVYDLEGSDVTGTIPIQSANVVLDAQNMGNSSVDVTMNIAAIKGGLIFDTDPLRGGGMFDTANFPTATFTSTSFKGVPNAATVTGRITIKGITRTVTLDARLLRQAGSNTNDLSRLVVKISGHINRGEFGLSTMGNMVADRVALNITVYLDQRQ